MAATAAARAACAPEAPVDVGPQADRDAPAPPQQRVDEGGATGGVVAQDEQLLELVDDQQRLRPVGHVEHGLDAGRHDDGVVDPGDPPGAGGSDEAGAQHGRLAAARRADDGDQLSAGHAGDEVGHDRLAAEEEALVAGLERQQAAVRALARRQRRADARPRERVDAFRCRRAR